MTAVIVGAGRSGLLAAARLKRDGIDGFLIVEKASVIGGRWGERMYPGSRTDIPSHLFAYSFASTSSWQRKFAEREEVQAYLADVAKTEHLIPHVRLGTEVTRADFDETTGLWCVQAATGQCWDCRFLILATGSPSKPSTPQVHGRRDFAGIQFSAADWNPSANVEGKRIVVIGTEGGAVQFVPRLARKAEQLTVVQDRPVWILPQQQKEYAPWTKTLFRWFQLIRAPHRAWLLAQQQWREGSGRHPDGWRSRRIERNARKQLHEQVADFRLREKLAPKEPLDLRLPVRSGEYYTALSRHNVELVTERPARIHQTGVELASGRRIPAEILVWATGSESGDPIQSIEVTGRADVELGRRRLATGERFKQVLVPGFPGLLLLHAPSLHARSAHNAFAAELSMEYSLKLIRLVLRRDLRFADVCPDAALAWQQKVDRRSAHEPKSDGTSDTHPTPTYFQTVIDTARFDPSDFTFASFGHAVPSLVEREPLARPARP